jgi:hypothetical protein
MSVEQQLATLPDWKREKVEAMIAENRKNGYAKMKAAWK